MIKTACFVLLMVMAYRVHAQWSLEECLQYAQTHNKEILAQAQAVKASASNRQAFQSRLLPQINGRVEGKHYWRIPVQAFPAEIVGGEPGTFIPVRISTPWTANYGVDASLNLLDPQAWQALKLSSLQVQMQQKELQSLKQLLLKNVRMAYYSVQAEAEKSEAMQLLYNSYTEIHRLLALQFDKGLIDQITFNQSLKLLNDRAEAKAQADVARQIAYLDLKFWMGYPLTDSLTITAETPTAVSQNNGFNARLLPDYEERRLRQLQARQQWRISRAQILPVVSASASYERIAFRNSFDFFGGGDWFSVGSIGLRLNIPILSLRQMLYEPSQQKALWKQASYQFERYQEEQEKVFQQEYMQLQQAYQVWQNQEENLKLARQNEALALQKIQRGIIDMVQLRQIQDELYQVQQRLSMAHLDYLRHYVELHHLQNSSNE